MYPSIKQQIPEFIEEYLVYCDCFTDINKQKTTWVLTRNLKFFEFSQKQLVGAIDLCATCLSKIKFDLENYKGAKGKWYGTSSSLSPMAEVEQSKISFGKYVFHALNIYKVYVIIQCWDKCIVLKRLPYFKGFEVQAEYEGLLGYRIIHGTIKYCPVLEFKFQNSDILKTDFEVCLDPIGEEALLNRKHEMRHLLKRIRCAKTELQLHKTITAQLFYSKQNNLNFGEPLMRSLKLEEKKILGRCGDIWKRFTSRDDLVIGVPLVNQCASTNLCIIRNLRPVLDANPTPENPIQLCYRLFQLNIKFEQLDDLETYLESEDEQLQEKIWCANGDLQILPESFVVLLIKLKISQIITLKESAMVLNYDIIKHLHTTSDANTSFTIPLQLFLQNLDFPKLLFEERSHYELKFLPHTLHQDFLTIAMTAMETNIKILFKNSKDLDAFESFIKNRLDFSKPTLMSDHQSDVGNFSSAFYNNKPCSMWFGCLLLRMKEIIEDENNQCLTTWKIYCQDFDKTLFLIKTFLNDQPMQKCNVISISNSNEQKTSECVKKFENALRQELLHLQKIVQDVSNRNHSQEHIKNLELLCKLQLDSDTIAGDCDIEHLNIS